MKARRDSPVPACCQQGHAFRKFNGVMFNTLVCMRCGKKVRGVGF